ncbi:hypothetical protein GRS48_01955 [Halorubrum sp. JWXQ-INN 858]|nr:hypothetical protein [Halorubrum sp. JWXQ-INN 858]
MVRRVQIISRLEYTELSCPIGVGDGQANTAGERDERRAGERDERRAGDPQAIGNG